MKKIVNSAPYGVFKKKGSKIMDKRINVLLDALIVITFIFGVLVGSGIVLAILTLGGFING